MIIFTKKYNIGNYNMLMKLLIVIILMFSCGCNPEEKHRSYQEVIEMIPDQKLVVHLKYIGKSPDESRWKKAHDYVSLNTDFYNLTLMNQSDFNFRLLSCEYSLKKGSTKNMKSFYSTKELEEIWNGGTIYAGESKTKFNSYTHSKKFSSNVLYKKYTFELQVEPSAFITNSFVVPFLYKKEN